MNNITYPECWSNPGERKENYKPNPFLSSNKKASDQYTELIGYKLAVINNVSPISISETIILICFGETFKLNYKLFDVSDAIEDSKSIVELQEGWGENGRKIEVEVYKRSIRLLVDYANYIFENYGIVVETPEINPVRNGSIDILWNTKNGYLLLNVKDFKNDYLGTFFGFRKSNRKIKEGEIDLNCIEPDMAMWMKDLCSNG